MTSKGLVIDDSTTSVGRCGKSNEGVVVRGQLGAPLDRDHATHGVGGQPAKLAQARCRTFDAEKQRTVKSGEAGKPPYNPRRAYDSVRKAIPLISMIGRS